MLATPVCLINAEKESHFRGSGIRGPQLLDFVSTAVFDHLEVITAASAGRFEQAIADDALHQAGLLGVGHASAASIFMQRQS